MAFEKCGYERQKKAEIPSLLRKRGYERQEKAEIPSPFRKRGYERQEEAQIPTTFKKCRYDSQEEDKIVHDLENEGIWNITIGRRTICLQIIGRYKIV